MKLYEGRVVMREHGYEVEWSQNDVKQYPFQLGYMLVVGELHGLRVLVQRSRYMSCGFLDGALLVKDVSNVLGGTIILRPTYFKCTQRDGAKVLILH